jgi:hypothetical protein
VNTPPVALRAVAWWRRNGLRVPRCGLCGLELPTGGLCLVCLDRLIVAGERLEPKGTNR